MTGKVHVLGFSGSLRKGSYNAAVLRLAAELVPEDMTLERFDIGAIPLSITKMSPWQARRNLCSVSKSESRTQMPC